jgi:hypothetical protein
MTLPAGRSWSAAAIALAGALAAGISWCILQSPLTLYDGLGPILDARRSESVRAIFESALYAAGYLRPIRMAQIKLVVDASPLDPTSAFKAIHVALVGAAFVLFAAWLRPRSAAEFVAAAIALVMLVGHHSFFVLYAEAYPINHFLEIVALAAATLLMARGEPRWWKDALTPIILAVALLTIESGILIGVVAVVCWMVGWRGITWRGAVACTLVILGYLYLRFFVLQVTSPGLDERATGWWLTRLEPEELRARFSEQPLPFYAYNVFAALLDVLLSEPRSGSFQFVRRWLEDDARPWMWLQLASSLLVSGLLLAALVPALQRWRRGALEDRDRFVLVAAALVAANTALSYGYVKDEVLSIGATAYAGGAFAVLARAGDRVTQRGRAAVMAALVLIAASALWTTRAVGTILSLQSSAYKVANDWATYSLERELPADWEYEPTRRTYLAIRERNVRYDVPHPRFTRQRDVDRYIEVQ